MKTVHGFKFYSEGEKILVLNTPCVARKILAVPTDRSSGDTSKVIALAANYSFPAENVSLQASSNASLSMPGFGWVAVPRSAKDLFPTGAQEVVLPISENGDLNQFIS